MKLLGHGIGWAQTGRDYMWTEDNGKDWRQIVLPDSPLEGSDGGGSSIEFVDTRRAWAIFIHHNERRPELWLSSTSNAGVTWTPYFRLNLPQHLPNPWNLPIYRCGVRFSFMDMLHGWMDVGLGTDTMNTWWSYLLVTSDGGRSWTLASGAPQLDDPKMLLLTPQEGWMVGSTHDDPYGQLYVTRDGAKSWEQVSVSVPWHLSPETETDYELPTFVDGKHGYLPVSYASYEGIRDLRSMALFATDDTGRTWKLDRTVRNTSEESLLQSESSTVADSVWIFVGVPDHHPKVTEVHHGETIDASAQATTGVGYRGANAVSFVSQSEGWALLANGHLLSTTDGGATWTDITPGPRDGFE
jgi:photosystem II stability/assembly factor-like uncharacterized protein